MENYNILATMDSMPKQSYVTYNGVKIGCWCSEQKHNKKKGKLSDVRNDLLEKLGWWRWSVPKTKKKPAKKDMSKPEIKPPITPKVSTEEMKEKRKARAKSELSTLHQKYKTMNSNNLNDYFKENPEKWRDYHKISKKNEKSFPEEEIPRNKMIRHLENLPGRRLKIVADLGCGECEIAKHFMHNDRFEFHCFDHVASCELVTERDIKDTGLEYYSIDIVIMSLAMWGSNCKEFLKEAYRILETGGTLLIAESYGRWNKELDENDNPIDRLVNMIEANNFKIMKKEEKKFMFIECIKY